PEGSGPERLDSFVARSVDGITRATVQKLIEEGLVTVGGTPQKASLKLKGGERLAVTIPPPKPAEAAAEEIPLAILYEDDDLVVVNKPAGMVVHPGAGTSGGTLVNALLAHCRDLSGIGGTLRPGIVHRIDKDTSGVLVAAKNDRAHQSLAHQFKEHTIKRVYLALVYGSPKGDRGRIESLIGRHPVDRKRMSGKARSGKHAVTHWQVMGRFGGITLMRLKLETGRTHQIRVHLSEAGHPLVGDKVYGGSGRLAGITDPGLKVLIRELDRQALHAKTLGFIHPASGAYLEFDTELPEDMARIVEYLENLIN
ncbi:MAG: RluA family pseudouridine synthase, partial [Geobacteraceae bacterium]|nr:RluA family pseudouridine synthase [Geobacteraceae bacterium]